MNKPKDFDTAQCYGEWEPLPAGGYVCKIMKVEETVSKNGADMIIISLDIAEGEYANYFANSYRSDTRPDKKWGCNMYQLIYDPVNKNNTNKGFKTFVTAVKNSNNNFEPAWGNAFCRSFKDKKVGCIFRREEYIGSDNSSKFYAKPYQLRSAETIKSGKFKIPEDKFLNAPPQETPAQNPPQNTYKNPDLSDFEEIVSDDDLPF